MPGMNLKAAAGNIMVVDDNPANLKLMGDMLGTQGYEVRLFPRGRMALAAANQHAPDLVLLDINMPEMDGYEVCRRMKSDPNLSQVPVVFLSALQDTKDKVKGLQSGGVDYISKPFQFEEVQARVETHLKIHRLQQELQLQNERLEEAVAARTRELEEAHSRLKIVDDAKSDFLGLIAHEFRTPLNGLLGVGDLALDEMALTPESAEMKEMFEVSRGRILSILDDALLLTEIDVEKDRFPTTPVPLQVVLNRAIERIADLARDRNVKVEAGAVEHADVIGDERLLSTALQALLEAAIKLTAPAGMVRLRSSDNSQTAELFLECGDTNIPTSLIPTFFDLFSISEASTPGVNLGLRPAVAYRILALFGGSVSISQCDVSSIRLTVSLKSAIAQRV
jgi:two-component system sensor histidine kinase/response regulator